MQKIRCEKRASAVGTYHVCSAPTQAQLTHVRSLALTRYKTASIGGDQESGFEQSFSALAYTYLKDKAPRLLDYIVGFQLVDRNEDNTKAMGIFGFKVGDQWLYAPVFFLNGDLKGHELLYIKKQDTFVPMKENWVNHIISRKPHTLGEGSSKTTHELGGLMPNLTRLTRIPTGSKYGSDKSCTCGKTTCKECMVKKAEVLPIHVDDWAKPFLPFCCALMTKHATALYPHIKTATDLNFSAVVQHPFKAAFAETAATFDMGVVLQDFPLLKLAFEKAYMAYPLIKKGFDRFYGPNFFRAAATTLFHEDNDLVKKAESYTVSPKRGFKVLEKRKRKPTPDIMPEEEPRPLIDKSAEIEIIALDVDPDAPSAIADNRPDLTEAEREKLLKDTVLIKDKRDPHSDRSSIAYNTQVRLELSNPESTGLYEVLEKPGSFDEMLVIINPHTGKGRENFALVLRKGDPRAWKNMDRGNLWAKQNGKTTVSEYAKWVEGLSGTDSLSKGGTYMAVGPRGEEGTCPFTIREDYGDGAYKVQWHDHLPWGESKQKYKYVYHTDHNDFDYGYSSYDAKICINKNEGTKLRANRGELVIPKEFKILKIKDPPKPKKDKDDLVECCMPSMDSGESEETPIKPGNILDVQLLVQKQAAASTVRIHDTGAGEVFIRSPYRGEERMSKKAALISLVRDHGFREAQASIMLKEATVASPHGRSVSYLVKYADGYGQGYDLQSGLPSAPAFPAPDVGVEQNGPSSVRSIYPQEEYLPVDGMDSQKTDPSVYDPFYTPDSQAMQTAQEASNSGQKEVFDASMLSGMLKSIGKNDRVDKYLGDLMKALDRVCRIYFMFCWHNDEFEERYGKQDMPELEDSLRNTIETLGDLSLFLKEKSVQGSHQLDMGGSVGDSSQSEPSIHESARN